MLKIEVDKNNIVEIEASGSTDVIFAEIFYAISMLCAKLYHDGKNDVARMLCNLISEGFQSEKLMVMFNEVPLRMLAGAIESGKCNDISPEDFERLVDVSGVVE